MKKKKRQKRVFEKIRKEWKINPTCRVKESKKVYSRKHKGDVEDEE